MAYSKLGRGNTWDKRDSLRAKHSDLFISCVLFIDSFLNFVVTKQLQILNTFKAVCLVDSKLMSWMMIRKRDSYFDSVGPVGLNPK